MREIPSDFAEQCRILSVRQMIVHYATSQQTIRKWYKALGLDPSALDKRVNNGARARKIPDDFSKNDKIMSVKELAKHYGASRNTVIKWRAVLPDARPARGFLRPVPDDFIERAGTLSQTAITDHYKAGKGTVARWYRETGVKPIHFKPPSLPIPDDFANYARVHTNTEVVEHFGVSLATVTAWRKKLNVPALRNGGFPRQKPRPAFNRPGPLAAPDSGRDDRPVGLAVEYMRSGSRGWQITRCDADGTFNPRGDHYRVGTMPIKTADEIMSWARDKGWKLVDIFSIAA